MICTKDILKLLHVYCLTLKRHLEIQTILFQVFGTFWSCICKLHILYWHDLQSSYLLRLCGIFRCQNQFVKIWPSFHQENESARNILHTHIIYLKMLSLIQKYHFYIERESISLWITKYTFNMTHIRHCLIQCEHAPRESNGKFIALEKITKRWPI